MQIHTVEIVLMDINSISRSRERILHPQFPEGKKHILLKKPNEYFTLNYYLLLKIPISAIYLQAFQKNFLNEL